MTSRSEARLLDDFLKLKSFLTKAKLNSYQLIDNPMRHWNHKWKMQWKIVPRVQYELTLHIFISHHHILGYNSLGFNDLYLQSFTHWRIQFQSLKKLWKTLKIANYKWCSINDQVNSIQSSVWVVERFKTQKIVAFLNKLQKFESFLLILIYQVF